MLKRLSTLALSSFVLLSGCFEDPNAPNGPSEVKLTAKVSNGFSTQGLTNLPVWSGGKAVITNIQFEYQGASTTVVQNVEATSTIDLSTGIATPALPTVTLTPGLYKKAKFKLHLKPDTLNFEVNGTWNGKGIKIENDHQEVVHAMTEEFLVDASKVYGVNIVIKPNSLFNKDDMNDSVLDGSVKTSDGGILISKTSNMNIYNSFVKNNLDKISSFEQTSQ